MAPAKGKGRNALSKSKTPEPRIQMAKQTKLKKTPKSAPQAKRKKLVQEIEDDISDEDFDKVLLGVKANGKAPVKTKEVSSDDEAEIVDSESEELDEDEEDDSENDIDDSDDDASSEDGEDDDEEEEDDDDDDSDSDGDAKPSTNLKKKLFEMFDKASSDDEEDDDEDDDSSMESDDQENDRLEKKITKAIKKKKIKDTPKPVPQKRKASDLSASDAKQAQKVQEDRDLRSLFVKNLPNSVTPTQIKSLCADIVNVRLRISHKKGSQNRGFAFIEFKNEKMADKYLPILKKKELDECQLVVDYVGVKSKKKPQTKIAAAQLDPLKLYVSGFGSNAEKSDLKKIFPSASSIDLPIRERNKQILGFAFIHFGDPDASKKALASAQNKSVKGQKITVAYGKKSKPKEVKKKTEKPAEPARKKAKVEVAKVQVQDNDDDDEEESDDDDDEDEDEVDEEDGDEEDGDDDDDGDEEEDEDDSSSE